MKRKLSLFLLCTSILFTGCDFIIKNPSNSTSENISSLINSSSSDNHSSIDSSISSAISSAISSSINSSIENKPSIDSSISDDQLLSFTINSSNYSSIGSYSTNFDTKTVNGYTFGHYRASSASNGNFISLVPYSSFVDDGSQEGSFYNVSPIFGIRYITITYKTNLDNDVTPLLLYGDDYSKQHKIKINNSKTTITETYCLNDSNFFEIDTNDNRITISSIKIEYTNKEEQYDRSDKYSGENEYRLNPIVLEENLIPGSTTIKVPIKVEYTSKGYNVLETKEYTYYTYEYIKSNPSLASKAALIDPIDIAAYYNTFKTHPCNYVVKKSYSSAKSLFGNNTRCISTYTRTNGYATSVPWQKQPSSNSPLYHELDIDIDNSYSSSNRGSGRLVVWQYGFKSTGYNSSPVSVFTNDHYATFQEYMNDGTFGTKFDAELTVSMVKFSPAVTKN
jgi:hypothetical protein